MGKLIIIEGSDGAGKATQTALLKEQLESKDYRVETFSYPQYDKTFFGKEVAAYLNGEYGSKENIDPRMITMLYGLDRFETKTQLQTSLLRNDFVICDRYTPTAVAHMTAMVDPEKRPQLQEWIEHFEYRILKLPVPDQIFYLMLPHDLRDALVEQKEARSYTDKKKDLHEADSSYQRKVDNTFYSLAHDDHDLWTTIPCADPDCAKGDVRGIFPREVITKLIMSHPVFLREKQYAEPIVKPNIETVFRVGLGWSTDNG